MNEKILQMITEYGLEAVILALGINVLTGLIKLPIKAWSKKLTDGTKLTRYLVFLPVFIGLLLTLAYAKVVYGRVDINRAFVTLWVSSSSLSLTFYAFWEKLFPTKERILKDYEIEANKQLLEKLRALAGVTEGEEPENEAPGEAITEETGETKRRIILRGRKHEEAEIKEESV